MLRSMFSAISGLRAHQTKMDVTGNNIANVNTVGFKGSQTVFQDTLSQVIRGRWRPRRGPWRHKPGAGRPRRQGRGHHHQLDPGRHPVHRPLDGLHDRGRRLLRDPRQRRRAAVHPRRLLRLRRRRQARHPGRLGPAGLDGRRQRRRQPQRPDRRPVGALRPARQPVGDHVPASSTATCPRDAAIGAVRPDRHHDVRQPGRARRRSSTTSRRPPRRTPGNCRRRPTRDDVWPATVRSSFSTAGDADHPGGTGRRCRRSTRTRPRRPATRAGPNDVTIDISGPDPVRRRRTPSARPAQDGYALGSLQSFQLGADGTIMGVYSNELRQPLGRLALASFNNPGGLEKAGNSSFRVGVNSGVAQVGTAGVGGRGVADVRRAGDVERRPRRGVHRPDRRPARLPGEQPRDHQLRRDPAGPGQPQALIAPGADSGAVRRPRRPGPPRGDRAADVPRIPAAPAARPRAGRSAQGKPLVSR